MALDGPQLAALLRTRWYWAWAWVPLAASLVWAWLVQPLLVDAAWLPEQWLTSAADTLFWVAMLGWLLVVPCAYFLRNQTYKKHWQGNAVTPVGYVRGNLSLFLLLNIPCMLGFLAFALSGRMSVLLVPMLVTAATMTVNFPTGQPMHAAAPRLGVSQK